MIRWLKTHMTRDIVRPLIHKVFTRGVLALFAAELVHFFAPAGWPLARFSNLAFFLAALFLLGTLIAWLRLDGMSIPQLKLPRIKRKDPPFLTGDIADHLDDEMVMFDDLDAEEQGVCLLLTDLILAAACLAYGFFL